MFDTSILLFSNNFTCLYILSSSQVSSSSKNAKNSPLAFLMPIFLNMRIRACHLTGSFKAKDNKIGTFNANNPVPEQVYDVEKIVLPPATYSHEKAKFEISRLIQSLNGDRVSMIVFAGTSHLYLPLTTDYEAALLFLHAIDTKMIPNQGTSISSAMDKAIDIVSRDEDKYKVVLLVTDGEDHEGDAINLAKKASGIGIEIHTIGIGSNAGGLIPIVENDNGQIGYKRDNNGRLITSVLNKNILKEIANAGNGGFYHFTNDGQNYTHINKAIQSMEKRVINSHEYSEYDQRYQPLALVSLLFFLVSFIFPTRNNYDKTN